MSSKRRKISSFLPIDKLAGEVVEVKGPINGGTRRSQQVREEQHQTGVSKRYKEYRRDPKVLEELTRISTEDFMPVSDDSDHHSATQVTAELGKKVGGIRESRPSESIDDEAFEHLEGTPPQKKSLRGSNGLLSSSPFDIWKNKSILIITKFILSGGIITVDVRKNMDEKSQCLLKFINDVNGPRMTFMHRNFEIKNAQIDFQKDCESVIFDKDYSYMGMVLKEPRFIDMDNKSKIGRAQTKLLAWLNSGSNKSNKIHKIRDILADIKEFKLQVVEDKEELLEELDKLASQEHNSKVKISGNTSNEAIEKLKNKRHFWEKDNFKSLGVQNRLSNYKSSSIAFSSGQKIRIPSISDSSEESSPKKNQQKTITNITPSNFYSKQGTERSDTSDLSPSFNPGLRRSSRARSETPKLIQSTLWDLEEKNFEIPQKLDPPLSYRFVDGSCYTITNQDFKCLYNHDWINDSILDFFTKFYVEKSISNSIVSREDIYIMSSFFYTKLISDPNDYYANVKKWVANSDLFNKKFVVVPINMNFHWFGCIITNLNTVLDFFQNADKSIGQNSNENKYKDDSLIESLTERFDSLANEAIPDNMKVKTEKVNTEEDEDVTLSTPIITILTFDSLRQTHTREIDPIKDFLIAYAKDKHGIRLDKTLIKMKTCAVPQQPNMSDCGVHFILNNKKFFDDPQKTMEIWRSSKARNRSTSKLINDFFDKGLRDTARKFLREVIFDLHEEQMKTRNLARGSSKGIGDDKYGGSSNCENEDDGDLEIIEDITEYNKTHLKVSDTDIEHKGNGTFKSCSEEPVTPMSHSAAVLKPNSSPEIKATPQNGSSKKIQNLQGRGPHGDTVHNRDQENDECISIEKVTPLSTRNFLESSPLQSSRKVTTSEVTSPYFEGSSLKVRAKSFIKPSVSSKTDNFGTLKFESSHQDELPKKYFASRPSSEVLRGKDNFIDKNIGAAEQASNIYSFQFQDRSLISDFEHDDDVKLIVCNKEFNEFPSKDDTAKKNIERIDHKNDKKDESDHNNL